MNRSTIWLRIASLVMTLSLLLNLGSVTAFAATPEEEAAMAEFDQWLDNVTIRSAGKVTYSSGSSSFTKDTQATPNTDDPAAHAQKILMLVNQEREAAGLEKVVWDSDFAACAQIRAEELRYKYSHERPGSPDDYAGDWPTNVSGKGIYNAPTVADEQGVEHSWIMENIAADRSTPEQCMQAWMDSEGHRNNILKESHTRCGVGVYYTDEETPSGYNWYWVLWFDNY